MKNITIYTSDSCPHCQTAKSYLSSHGFKFTEKNVKESNYRKELISKGYRGVPVIIIDDIEIVGFDKEKINSILNI
ncbi:MAG: glutaredoxin family protein [Clostridia bacterium]|nr:glutaredoxin family protein [Clostridia bacterium]